MTTKVSPAQYWQTDMITNFSDTGATTQLWLVTEYLPNGSLYDHLEQNKLSLTTAIQFVRSISHGLAYLHAEVPGVKNQCRKNFYLRLHYVLYKNSR